MQGERTPQSEYLLRLGRKILAPYTRLPNARAAMITGSCGRRGVRPLFRSRHDGLLRRRAAERGDAGGDPRRPWRAGARVASGRARRRQHRRGVRARRRAGADRARDDRGVGKRHRRSARAMERRHAAAQGDVGNARMRRRPRRRLHRPLEGEDPRLPRGARARDGRDAAADLSGLVRPGRARRARRDRSGISRSASRPPTPHRHSRRLESSLLHDVPVQEDAALLRPDARSSRSGFAERLEDAVPADARRGRGVARSCWCARCSRWSSAKCRRWTSPGSSGVSEAGGRAGSTPQTGVEPCRPRRRPPAP